jgi:phage terminase large subunit
MAKAPPLPPGGIVLPHKWRPRAHQRKLWNFLDKGGKRAVAVWHRRAGKDSVAINFAACAASRRVANYWHMLPTAAQGRKVVWEGIDGNGCRVIDQAFPPGYRTGKLDDEMLLRLSSGSTWQVVGSDNFDRLVGANPAGVVFSEWALADPRAWDYLRPILAENGGWALFIYTPRGRNHGAATFDMAAKTPGWFAEKLTVEDTGVLAPEVIEEDRRSGMADELIRQEYYCSFQAALVGAYYGPLLETAEREGRVRRVAWEPDLPVVTAWDLGIGDSTAIWFAQLSGREIRLIDYYEASGVGLDHYARVLQQKPYVYGEILLPHDARQREMANGRTRLETMRRLGIARQARIVPSPGLDDGINAARVILPRCWFDETGCARGLEALRQYRRAWDDERKIFGERPLHDWSSHAADAFRYLAVGLREPRRPGEAPLPVQLDTTEGGETARPYDDDGRPTQAVME